MGQIVNSWGRMGSRVSVAESRSYLLPEHQRSHRKCVSVCLLQRSLVGKSECRAGFADRDSFHSPLLWGPLRLCSHPYLLFSASTHISFSPLEPGWPASLSSDKGIVRKSASTAIFFSWSLGTSWNVSFPLKPPWLPIPDSRCQWGLLHYSHRGPIVLGKSLLDPQTWLF